MERLTRTAFALLAGMTVCLAAATFVEKAQGSDFALRHIYHSGWFVLWWIALAAVSLTVAVLRLGRRRKAALLLHASLGLILLGALLTFTTSRKGYVHLRSGECRTAFVSDDGRETRLPFALRLDRFEIEYYPGTQAPADYLSFMTVIDGAAQLPAGVSMNRIFSYAGYRLYQTSFDGDLRGSILSVNYDPWGVPVTYAGYLLLGVSMVAVLCSRGSGFRRLLRHPLLRRAACTLLLAGGACAVQAAPATLSRTSAEAFGRLRMLYGDRVAPVQTFARDFTVKVCGKPSYGGYTAEQVLAGWIFFPEQWQFEPMIRIKDDPVRQSLGTGKRAALTDFFNPDGSYKLAGKVRFDADRRNEPSKAFAAADEQVQLIAMLRSGQVLKLFPQASGTGWHAPTDGIDGLPGGDSVFIKGIFPLLYEAVTNGRENEVRELIGKIASFQRKRGGDSLLSPSRLTAETWYNRFDPVPLLYRTDLCCGVLAFAYFVWSFASGRRKRWMERLFPVPLAVSLLSLSVLLALRGYAAGHLPMSNGYETMMFAAWCVAAIALWLRHRFAMVAASGLLLSGFVLLVASLGMMNPQITPLVPVLRSGWLSLHVSLVMVSYALLGLVALNGLTGLVVAAVARARGTTAEAAVLLRRLQLTGRLFLYPAVFLLAAGIFVGAVWANVSWGRYWGWDPKETWALVTWILYALPLHDGSLVRFRRPLFFHAYCVSAFAAVAMTYFGVNYFLGGMHGYAAACAAAFLCRFKPGKPQRRPHPARDGSNRRLVKPIPRNDCRLSGHAGRRVPGKVADIFQ